MRQYNLGLLGLALPNCFLLITGLKMYDQWVSGAKTPSIRWVGPPTCDMQVAECRIQEQNTLWCPSCCIPGRSSDVCEIPEVCSRTALQFLVINYRIHHGFIMDCQMDLRWIVSAIQCPVLRYYMNMSERPHRPHRPRKSHYLTNSCTFRSGDVGRRDQMV